jgi:hypothetical protein
VFITVEVLIGIGVILLTVAGVTITMCRVMHNDLKQSDKAYASLRTTLLHEREAHDSKTQALTWEWYESDQQFEHKLDAMQVQLLETQHCLTAAQDRQDFWYQEWLKASSSVQS